MSNINTVSISGNITRDAVKRGESVVAFSIASNESRKVGEEWKEVPNYVDCVMFGKRAASLFEHELLKKGTKVFITGSLRYSTYEKNGDKRSKLEVVVNDIDVAPRKSAE